MGSDASRFDAAHGLSRMRERTREARDHEALQLFSAEKIDAVLSAAAARGQSSAVFAPSIPMDLSDSDTAKAAFSMLEKAGFSVSWQVLRASPEAEPTTVLRVSWGADAKPRAG